MLFPFQKRSGVGARRSPATELFAAEFTYILYVAGIWNNQNVKLSLKWSVEKEFTADLSKIIKHFIESI